jgi:hypothetical protein
LNTCHPDIATVFTDSKFAGKHAYFGRLPNFEDSAQLLHEAKSKQPRTFRGEELSNLETFRQLCQWGDSGLGGRAGGQEESER